VITEPQAVFRELLSYWDARIFTGILVFALPGLGYLRFRRFLSGGSRMLETGEKLQLYARIILTQWLLVFAMALLLRRHGLSLADAGQRVADPSLTWLTSGGLLLVLAIVAILVMRRVRRAPPDGVAGSMERIRGITPFTRGELAAFCVVCLTAGICEELLYRGWLVSFLWAATGSRWAGVGIGAAAFGMGHAYQGKGGVLRTTFIGAQLGALFVLIGSLIPGQLLHAGVDLLAALVMFRMNHKRTGAVQSA